MTIIAAFTFGVAAMNFVGIPPVFRNIVIKGANVSFSSAPESTRAGRTISFQTPRKWNNVIVAIGAKERGI